jgi:hypothetical protein
MSKSFYYKTLRINVRENRRGNQQWTIQSNWKHLGTLDTRRRQNAISTCAVDQWFETRSGRTKTIELSFVSSPIRT